MNKITLIDLLKLFDTDLESSKDKIQICDANDWDVYDEICLCSDLLKPFYGCEVLCMGAIKEDTIRVDINWEEADA